MLANASGNCLVTGFNFLEITEVTVDSDGTAHIAGVASPVV